MGLTLLEQPLPESFVSLYASIDRSAVEVTKGNLAAVLPRLTRQTESNTQAREVINFVDQSRENAYEFVFLTMKQEGVSLPIYHFPCRAR